MPNESNSQKVTMLDVAKACGISHQTVSRVINNSPNVSAKTRRQVLRAIETLGYHPNQFARSLKTRRSFILEVITFGVETYIPRELIVALGRTAKTYGYRLILTDVKKDDQEEENRVWAHINSGFCDGAILTAPVESRLFDKITANPPNIPLIQIRNKPASAAPSVMIDQYAGEKLATRHLLDLGHRQIAEISGPLNYHEALMRHQSFLDTLSSRGLTPVCSVEATEWMPSEGYQAACKLLDQGLPFSGLIVSNDYLALGTILALSERGLRVPEDVSIVGFDDAPESAYFMPPLTTVRQDYEALGQQSIQYLVDVINDPETPVHQRILMPQLIERKSTRAV
jgi:LacI family transcriptional regulator